MPSLLQVVMKLVSTAAVRPRFRVPYLYAGMPVTRSPMMRV